MASEGKWSVAKTGHLACLLSEQVYTPLNCYNEYHIKGLKYLPSNYKCALSEDDINGCMGWVSLFQINYLQIYSAA